MWQKTTRIYIPTKYLHTIQPYGDSGPATRRNINYNEHPEMTFSRTEIEAGITDKGNDHQDRKSLPAPARNEIATPL